MGCLHYPAGDFESPAEYKNTSPQLLPVTNFEVFLDFLKLFHLTSC